MVGTVQKEPVTGIQQSYLQLRDAAGYPTENLRVPLDHRLELWRILPGRTPGEVFLCSIAWWEIPHLHRLTAKPAVDKVTKGE